MNKLIYVVVFVLLSTIVFSFEESFSVRADMKDTGDSVKLSLWSSMNAGSGSLVAYECSNPINLQISKNKCSRMAVKLKQRSRAGEMSIWEIEYVQIHNKRDYFSASEKDNHLVTIQYSGGETIVVEGDAVDVERVR